MSLQQPVRTQRHPLCVIKPVQEKKKKKLLGKEMDQPVIGDRNLRAGQRSAVFE